MNKLFYETLANIQYRIHKEESEICDLDPLLMRALKNSLEARSIRGIAIKFITSLKSLFESFHKNNLIDYFEKKFIDDELVLEAEIKHESHILHVIRVFLIGYNIITSWSYLADKFKENNNSPQSFFKFSRFCLSWLIASLFHDFGYIIETAHERFRKINQQYGDILRDFKGFKELPEEPIGLGKNWTVAERIHDLYKVKLHKNLTFEEFKDLFEVKGKSSEIKKLDHGLVSAICHIKMIEIAQEQYITELKKESDKLGYINQDWYESEIQTKFMNSEMNIYACLAMLLHNFHMIPFEQEDKRRNLSLSCCRDAEIIPYLLMICDLVQDWDRQRQDYDIYNNKSDKINAKKKLDFCKFGDNLAIFQINHILQEKLNIREYAIKLGKDLLLKQERITMKIKYLYPIDLKGKIVLPRALEEKFRFQKKPEEQSHFILKPIEKDKYKIVLNHAIEGILYYTVTYYL